MKTYDINSFLKCVTPSAWVEYALKNIAFLLVDHAHCEKKAASSALSLIYRYADRPMLLQKMSKLAREELRHFEQVLTLITNRGESFYHVLPGRYATELHQHATTHEPFKLIDTLIIGTLIEARSCERFMLLGQYLEDEIGAFYRKLYRAEERHFQEYLYLAKYFAATDIDTRIEHLSQVEASLINTSDPVFRFHSGRPSDSNSKSSTPSLIKSPT